MGSLFNLAASVLLVDFKWAKYFCDEAGLCILVFTRYSVFS